VIITCATGKSVGQVPSLGVGAPAGEILVIELDADAHRTRRRLEQAEHELAPATTDVEHGRHIGVGGEAADQIARRDLQRAARGR
jgi:hypothetical protein